MKKQAIKELLFGGINELMRNRSYYYKSTVGRDYCYFTEDGKEAVQEFVVEISKFINAAEEAELDQRAKDIVINTLKN